MNKKTKKIITNTIIIILIMSGIAWIASLFIHFGGEYTNNAQVRQNIVDVSSRVQGFIKEIYFDEFQYVKKGDTLLVIEDAEFRLQLAQAEADYLNATAGKTAFSTNISTIQNNVLVTESGIEEVKVLLNNAEADYLRYQQLLDKGAVTRQQFDGVKTQYEALKAKLETMQRQKQSTQLVKSEQTQRLTQQDANIAVRKAALDLALLNLSYTVIVAPCDGYTSRKTIQIGELVNPGQNIVSIVNDEEPWIIANYRETQLQNIKVGNKVKIQIDAFPNAKFEGVVAAISDATGAQYSITQPDNSIGNFVKTQQRIPIKILFTDNNNADELTQLQAGMNVECTISK